LYPSVEKWRAVEAGLRYTKCVSYGFSTTSFTLFFVAISFIWKHPSLLRVLHWQQVEGEKEMKGIVSLSFLRRQYMRGLGMLCDVLSAWLVVSLSQKYTVTLVYT